MSVASSAGFLRGVEGGKRSALPSFTVSRPPVRQFFRRHCERSEAIQKHRARRTRTSGGISIVSP